MVVLGRDRLEPHNTRAFGPLDTAGRARDGGKIESDFVRKDGTRQEKNQEKEKQMQFQ